MKVFTKENIKTVWPIWFGYVPLGLAAGILSEKVGLTPGEIGLMSLLVFAGSGQFIALAMIGSAGASLTSIILTTFVVNLRHLLYSSTLVPFLRGKSRFFLCFFSQGIVDETFAVNYNKFASPGEGWTPAKAACINYLALGCWAASTVAGNLVGSVIQIDTALVGYTLTAMFIGLWSFHFNNAWLVIVGLIGGVLALLFSTVLAYKLHIVVATLLAATIGSLLESGVGGK